MQESNQINAYMGSSVASAGDVNGDGYSDIVVGAHMYDKGQGDEGAALVWLGGARGTNIYSQEITGYQDFCSFGRSVANAGDVNGDGFSDIIVGAYEHNSGQANSGAAYIYYGSLQGINLNMVTKIENVVGSGGLGFSVAGAGDVNGDGFDDVIIGDMSYFVSWNPQKGLVEGAALIYYGSNQGLITNTPSILKNSQTQSSFGWTVSSAGDVNGDGYDDVLVGDPNYDKQFDEGAAYVYYGSGQGINTVAAITLEGDQQSEQFGGAVSNAGDVNGDGFDDILVGAGFYSNNQSYSVAAFIFYGSGSGVSNNPTIIENKLPDTWNGYSVSGAGDLNGDGFNDIAVGIPDNQAGDGGTFIYYGSSAGININSSKTILKIGQPSYFGNSVSEAGDFNGDGYGDLLIGAVQYSQIGTAAFIYLGSANGVNSQTPITFGNNIANSNMGESVAYAGDVNGDGYSDVLIGATSYNTKGSALLFKGNNGNGLRNNLRLYNSADLLTPINHTQFAQNNFGAGFFAKSFLGRGKGKLVWETKPLAQGFSKGSNNAITNSTQSTGSQNTYSNLGLAGIELKNVISKQGPSTKVRVRVKYHPALALTGQAYGPWRYLPAYLMGNSTAPVPDNTATDMAGTIKKKANMEVEALRDQVAVYPNPVSEHLKIDIKNPDQVRAIEILTNAGSVIYQTAGFKSAIDMNRIPNGTYFVVITNHDGSQTTRKILVTK
ncbi:FG-GAP-like repeat-containing protein [Dyadobacter sp. CY261]|uniref:FG-GAP-like repeat-containing protein n=1 Tax=Dyadobacter sp. CY261 TaxID=2907203 RepID=UPI001F3E50A8|nr:FG-GAP-like repeat-containing protein [Dyadobacter sp. CY261]MCF0073621.1 FG-GAP-like repeat-containing protein [Dyadobacter sp. CY261]